MSRKNKLSLSKVLEEFNKTLEKSAESESKVSKEEASADIQDDTNDDAVEKVEKVEKKKPVDSEDAVEEKEKTEKKKPVDSEDAVEKAEKGDEKTATADTLKEIAKTAAEKSEASMVKEAEEFGRLFAHTVMGEMEKIARENEEYGLLEKQAYDLMNEQLFMDKLAQVYDEAYGLGSEYLIQKEAYDKTASYVEKTAEKGDVAAMSEMAESIIKEAYELTQQLLDQKK